MKNKLGSLILCVVFALSTMLFGCRKEEIRDGLKEIKQVDGKKDNSEALLPKDNFVRAQGKVLIDKNNKELLIKGISFGNEVWGNPLVPPSKHHTEDSYRELSEAGFNSIRFYLNYGIFENDSKPYEYKQSGWDWLDKNIAWAKKYNMYLILNMHYPQGGFQSLGEGMDLWTKRDNQLRLIALWKEIARRYKNEPTIMAFDLLNEPVVSELSTEEETFKQWPTLAKEIIDGIREVDPNHLIIVERLNASKNLTTGQSNWDINRNGNMNFFTIKDANIAYEFHMYSPMEFTHQNASWVSGMQGKFTEYPDENSVQANGSVNWEGCTNSNPILNTSETGWQQLQGIRFKITNTTYMIGKPALQAVNTGEDGEVWFDDIILKEYDEKGNFVRTVKELPFDNDDNWYFWQANNKGGTGGYDGTVGHTGKGSMKIKGTTDDSNLAGGSWVLLKQGYSYEISGYARGEKLNPSAQVRIRLDFYSCDSVSARNKQYLEAEVAQYLKFGNENNVPLYLGEFGAITDSFKEGRGGERWVSDMIDILKANKVNFNYHTYHETSFGLYTNPAYMLPDNLNTALMKVFQEKLK